MKFWWNAPLRVGRNRCSPRPRAAKSIANALGDRVPPRAALFLPTPKWAATASPGLAQPRVIGRPLFQPQRGYRLVRARRARDRPAGKNRVAVRFDFGLETQRCGNPWAGRPDAAGVGRTRNRTTFVPTRSRGGRSGSSRRPDAMAKVGQTVPGRPKLSAATPNASAIPALSATMRTPCPARRHLLPSSLLLVSFQVTSSPPRRGAHRRARQSRAGTRPPRRAAHR